MKHEDIWKRLTVRLYRPGDEKGIVDLYNVVFDADRTIEQWRWEFCDLPSGYAAVAVADLDGTLVGQYSALVQRLTFFGGEIARFHTVDVMVHPEFRRHGILTRAANFGFDTFGPCIGIGHGFPTMIHYNFGIRKLGYHKICFFPKYFLPLTASAFVPYFSNPSLLPVLRTLGFLPYWIHTRTRKKPKPLSDVDIVSVQAFGEEADRFWEHACTTAPIMGVRDRAFLNWRFLSRPGTPYSVFAARRNRELLGVVALSIHALRNLKVGIIDDLLAIEDSNNESIVYALLDHAVSFFRTHGVERVNVRMLCPKYQRMLLRYGFIRYPSDKVIVARSFKPHVRVPELCSPRNWFLTIGDTDWYTIRRYSG